MTDQNDMAKAWDEGWRAAIRSSHTAPYDGENPYRPIPHTAGCRDWMNSAPGRPCVCHVAKGVPDDY